MTDGAPVVVTGADGFIGRNLIVALRREGLSVATIGRDTAAADIRSLLAHARLIFHLAGTNRPVHESEFVTGNVESLRSVLTVIEPLPQQPQVVLASSTQAAIDNPYGRSKLEAEGLLIEYANKHGFPAAIYRLPGVFGKWCRPEYNSVVATFCHRIARDLPISVTDPERSIDLVYIDDVVRQFLTHLEYVCDGVIYPIVEPVFRTTVGALAATIRRLRAMRESLEIPDVDDPLTRRLLGTFTSYWPQDNLDYELFQRVDQRGTLAELVKSACFGQIFVSRTFPGMVRGNHYHDLKVEKFCVLSGDALIRFRSITGHEVIEYRVLGTEFRVIDIPPGMTHSIENIGDTEMIVLFWASEIFSTDAPDTYADEVVRG